MDSTFSINRFNASIKENISGEYDDIFFSLCLSCGSCSGGCPASGIMDMDPRKLIHMVNIGLDANLNKNDWIWVCTMCARCVNACPMKVNIPKLVFNLRKSVTRKERPKGILKSCDNHIKSGNAMGAPREDFVWTIKDLSEEVRVTDLRFENLKVSIDRKNACIVLNQNSREPVTEPDEMVPLWKILHEVNADWTYPSIMWGGENYCMFMADNEGWRYITEEFVDHVDNNLNSEMLVNTE